MFSKSRFSESFKKPKAASVKNWAIGWTLAEANAAANRQTGVYQSQKKIGCLGMLTPDDRR
jgi:hypothetical protein